MGCGIGSCAKTTGAGHDGSTLYLDKEGGLDPANCPWQIHGTLQCARSHFVTAVLPTSSANSTILSGWNPQVAASMVCLKEKKEKTVQAKTQTYSWCKTCAAESCQRFSVLAYDAGVLLLRVNLGMVE